MRRRCLGCRALIASGSRCARCTSALRAKYHGGWEQHAAGVIAAWRAEHGDVCPGWRRDSHPSSDLTLDHDVGVLCRGCNTRKKNGGGG